MLLGQQVHVIGALVREGEFELQIVAVLVDAVLECATLFLRLLHLVRVRKGQLAAYIWQGTGGTLGTRDDGQGLVDRFAVQITIVFVDQGLVADGLQKIQQFGLALLNLARQSIATAPK